MHVTECASLFVYSPLSTVKSQSKGYLNIIIMSSINTKKRKQRGKAPIFQPQAAMWVRSTKARRLKLFSLKFVELRFKYMKDGICGANTNTSFADG